ncbi:hypothetical protein SAMN05444168_6637 [Paraburkholderia phenazinium]|uniref:Uncharacterized protein n=1 Tax=Paraburkholderia phenazinium TaxID=60549 RepID=A0A1N6KB08_9BURK|nr:hypothetical protein SAMN05444168_6637 [Paraburkholderia phenazinium]
MNDAVPTDGARLKSDLRHFAEQLADHSSRVAKPKAPTANGNAKHVFNRSLYIIAPRNVSVTDVIDLNCLPPKPNLLLRALGRIEKIVFALQPLSPIPSTCGIIAACPR